MASQSIQRLKAKLQRVFHQGRGRNLGRVMRDLSPVIRGWVAYFRLSEVKAGLKVLDEWLQRKLPRTRAAKLRQLGLDPERVRASAWNGRGPWWNAGASHMNQAVPTAMLRRGLLSFLDEYRRLACNS